MADYRAIKGLTIQTVSSDPSNLVVGDVWYNSTLGKIRGAKTVGSWASGGALNTGRYSLSGTGIQTAGIAIGGFTPGGASALTESYDGSSFSETGDLNTGRRSTGAAGT